MKNCWLAISLVLGCGILNGQQPSKQSPPKENVPQEHRIARLPLDSQNIGDLHVHSGYVSSVRMPDDISSVVLGDPVNFKAEHSDAEPRMVFVKPVTSRATETNMLITTVAGREVSLHVVNDPKQHYGGEIDFIIDYQVPKTMFIQPTVSASAIPDSADVSTPENKPDKLEAVLREQAQNLKPSWQGKDLQVSLGHLIGTNHDEQMILAFSVQNGSSNFVEVLPPQLVMQGSAKSEHTKVTIKADPLTTLEYRLTSRRIAPGARIEGVVVFERPTFKESGEGLFLQVAQADQVDKPVRVAVPFTTSIEGDKK